MKTLLFLKESVESKNANAYVYEVKLIAEILMNLFKTGSLFLQAVLYIIAGSNHFWHPKAYLRIMPAYLPYHLPLVYLSGFFEISLGILLIFPRTRALAGIGIVLMLAAFIPIHLDMLIHAPMRVGGLTVTGPMAWGRLILQFVLMAWIWFASH